MSERTDQNPQAEPVSRNDPLAELARIVAGENPVEVTAPRLLAESAQPTLGMEAEAQVDFSADIASEALPGTLPPAMSEQAPPVQADDVAGGHIVAAADFDLEASLESQLMQEFDVAGIDEALAANPVDVDIPGLREVETLAEEFVSETTIGEPAGAETPSAPAPFDNYDVTQEFASEVVPSHLVQAGGDTAFNEPASVGTGDADVSISAGSSNDLGDNLDAKFEEIAQQAAAAGDLQFTSAAVDGGLNLEAEFESAFASELDQNDILPETSTPFIAPQVNEFDTPFSGNVAVDAPTGPEHLSDPAMFEEAVPANELGVSPPPARRSGFKMAALALGIALLGGFAAVGYGYFSNDRGDDAPIVVMADPGDVKVKPLDRGGIVIANQDKASYAEISGNKEEGNQESLFSGTEIANEPPKVSALEPKFEERLTPGSPTESSKKPAAIAPRKVRTFTVKPDGTILTPEPLVTGTLLNEAGQARSLVPLQPVKPSIEEPVVDVAVNDPVIVAPKQVETVRVAPPAAVETAPPIVEEPQQVAVVVEPEPKVEIVNIVPEPIDGATAKSGDIAVPQQSPLPKPVKVAAPAAVAPSRASVEQKLTAQNDAPIQLANAPAPTASVQSSASSPWAIQISSQRSRSAADASYQNLLRRFPSLLNGRSFNIREAQVSGKGTFFRVRIQADSQAAASNFCTQFKSSGGSCFITR